MSNWGNPIGCSHIGPMSDEQIQEFVGEIIG